MGMHKLHPSCYGNHNPIDSALAIVREHAFSTADIESVTLEVPPQRIKHFLNQPVAQGDKQPRLLFSIPYGVANVLTRKEVRLEHYTDQALQDTASLELTRKVRLVPDDTLGKTHAGRLSVTLKDGQVFSAYRESPVGWAENPASSDQIREKYWRNIEFGQSVSSKSAAKALEMLDRLEDVQDMGELAACLTGQV